LSAQRLIHAQEVRPAEEGTPHDPRSDIGGHDHFDLIVENPPTIGPIEEVDRFSFHRSGLNLSVYLRQANYSKFQLDATAGG
jgi:hypothetical protein